MIDNVCDNLALSGRGQKFIAYKFEANKQTHGHEVV